MSKAKEMLEEQIFAYREEILNLGATNIVLREKLTAPACEISRAKKVFFKDQLSIDSSKRSTLVNVVEDLKLICNKCK